MPLAWDARERLASPWWCLGNHKWVWDGAQRRAKTCWRDSWCSPHLLSVRIRWTFTRRGRRWPPWHPPLMPYYWMLTMNLPCLSLPVCLSVCLLVCQLAVKSAPSAIASLHSFRLCTDHPHDITTGYVYMHHSNEKPLPFLHHTFGFHRRKPVEQTKAANFENATVKPASVHPFTSSWDKDNSRVHRPPRSHLQARPRSVCVCVCKHSLHPRAKKSVTAHGSVNQP